jgi:hypothetical protein
MQKRTLILALFAAVAMTAGLALGFFELAIAGIVGALAAVALWLEAIRSATNPGTLRYLVFPR